MCFSAEASFTVAAVLVPMGGYTIGLAHRSAPRWTAFAAFPLAFGLQQAIEGLVWIGMETENLKLISAASRGFLFFSHFFWLAWVPFAAWRLEQDPRKQCIMRGLTALGTLYGLSIFLPAAMSRFGLAVEVIEHSLEYHTTLLYEGWISRSVLKIFYAIIVVSALFLSSERLIRIIGLVILASLLLTYAAFSYAFISVWCFFAAVLSLYLVFAVRRAGAQADLRNSAGETP